MDHFRASYLLQRRDASPPGAGVAAGTAVAAVVTTEETLKQYRRNKTFVGRQLEELLNEIVMKMFALK